MVFGRGAAGRRVLPENRDGWWLAERALAVFAVFLVGLRLKVQGGITAGDLVGWAMVPLWVPALRRYRGAFALYLTALVALASCYVLTRWSAIDHHVSMKLNTQIIRIILSAMVGAGVVVWARQKLSSGWLFAAYGLGMLVAKPDNMKLFSENPWKFHYSVPLTIIVVGIIQSQRRPRSTIAALLVFAALCGMNDARSNLSVLVLVATLLVWRLFPAAQRRRVTVVRTLAALVTVGAVAYYALMALIMEGVLGQATRERSIEQIQTSGNLVVGGRPEMAASWALFKHHPFGFGGGTFLNSHEMGLARDAMTSIGYDPTNQYLEKFMFVRGIELHSMTADLWAWCGIAGLVFAVALLAQAMATLSNRLTNRPMEGAVTIFCVLLTLWNLPFSPWLSSIPILSLMIGTGLVPRDEHILPRRARRAA